MLWFERPFLQLLRREYAGAMRSITQYLENLRGWIEALARQELTPLAPCSERDVLVRELNTVIASQQKLMDLVALAAQGNLAGALAPTPRTCQPVFGAAHRLTVRVNEVRPR